MAEIMLRFLEPRLPHLTESQLAGCDLSMASLVKTRIFPLVEATSLLQEFPRKVSQRD